MRRAVAIVMTMATLSVPAAFAASANAQRPAQRPVQLPGERPMPLRAEPDTPPPPKREELAVAADGVRQAWLKHDAAKIVANSPQLVIQLPGADPSASLGARQAAALLTNYFADSREVELAVRAVREVEQDRGSVELTRRYRMDGTQNVRVQSVFLGYRRGRAGWVLVELRAIGP